jgi:hypothetical protein
MDLICGQGSVSCGAPLLDGQVITLSDVNTFDINPNPITGDPTPGDFFNATYVNLLTGYWDKYPFGVTTHYTTGPLGTGFVYQDIMPWTGGELVIVSETFTFSAVPRSVPEPTTLVLMGTALILLAALRTRRSGTRGH